MTSSSIENTERLEALSVCGGVDYSEKSDLDLVNLMCDGDGDAFVEIVSRYETKLIAYSRRYVGSLDLAKDICQEVFLKLIGKPPATLQNDNLGPWLFRVSHNLAIDIIRRRKFELTGESLPEVTSSRAFKDIAEVLDIPQGTALWRMHEAINQLRSMWRRYES